MKLKELERRLKNVSTKQLQREIDILDENLESMHSSGTTIVDLKTYRIVRDAYKGLNVILRKRNGCTDENTGD